jgi:hypothetical protein
MLLLNEDTAMLKFDIYSRKARLYPALLVVLPIFLFAVVYLTIYKEYVHYLTAIAGLCGLTFLVAEFGRDRGKSKEPALYQYWGGKPTTVLMRHSCNLLDKHTRARYHRQLEDLINHLDLPTAEEEAADLVAADELYESCTRYLLSKTRDTKKFNLLFKENISYGFRRNLWGMKTTGIIIGTACLLLNIIVIYFRFTATGAIFGLDVFLSILLTLVLLIWIFVINRDWVKIPAYAYAERLLETSGDID